MVSSIDGRLISNRWTPPPAGVDADALFAPCDETAATLGADGWIVGRKTMESYASGVSASPSATGRGPRTPQVVARDGRDIAVVSDPAGKLRYDRNTAGGDLIVTVLGETVSDTYLAELCDLGSGNPVPGSRVWGSVAPAPTFGLRRAGRRIRDCGASASIL